MEEPSSLVTPQRCAAIVCPDNAAAATDRPVGFCVSRIKRRVHVDVRKILLFIYRGASLLAEII